MKIFKKFSFLLFTILIATTYGCKGKKTSVKSSGGLASKAQNELIDDVLKSQLDYQTIYTKGQIEIYKGDKKKKFSTVFKIIKDQSIQASIRPLLGIEVARVTLTTDSVILLDRFNKRYMADSFAELARARHVDFNFYNLQALLTNQLFLPSKKEIMKKDYKSFDATSSSDVYVLKAKDNNRMNYTFTVDATNRVTSTMIFNLDRKLSLLWSYEDFVENKGYTYPTHMTAKVNYNTQEIKLGVSYSKLDINSDITIDSSIPKSYNKITLKQILSILLEQ